METNVEKTILLRISRQPFPVKIMIDPKQLENVESFKYLGSMLTNGGRCTCEIKSRIAVGVNEDIVVKQNSFIKGGLCLTTISSLIPMLLTTQRG
jgi:hypothetical protein